MQIFIDTANVKEIIEAASLGLIDGVTTNPSLMAKEAREPFEVLKEICDLIKGPVSAEVIGLKCEEMLKEGRILAKIAGNIVIKVPLNKEGIKAVRVFADEGIKTNVTLCFSAAQALLVAKAGATYVSPFIGRLDDIAQEGMKLIEDIKKIYSNYNFSTKIIVASVRNPMHVVNAALLGADIATIPFSVIEQLIKHPLTDIGINSFLEDYKKIPQGKNVK